MLAVLIMEPGLNEESAEVVRAAPSVPLDAERSVVERLQRGDRGAFATLYRWYGDPIYRAVLVRLPVPELAEDVLRETFRTCLEKIATFTWQGRSIWFWLHRIAVNKAMDAHRRHKRDQHLADRVQAEPAGVVVADATEPDRGLEVDDTAREVQVSLSRLNPRYADVLRMRLLEERSREDCAAEMGITLANLDVLLHRACKAFRKVYPP